MVRIVPVAVPVRAHTKFSTLKYRVHGMVTCHMDTLPGVLNLDSTNFFRGKAVYTKVQYGCGSKFRSTAGL